MSILVTGAAGFIGCNNVLALNRRGVTDIIAVDNLEKSEKFLNLAQCRISDYFDKRDFIARVRAGTAPKPEAIFHQGACSDTMEQDGVYMMENNYRYTLDLYRWAQSLHIPFIYASSAATYGAKTTFREELEFEGPLNVYGYSKFLFDQVLRREFDYLRAPVIGLRYFNVYGPHEQHKGRMASVAFHQYFQYRRTGKVKLFEGCLGYGNGEQLRDFVYIDDAARAFRLIGEHGEPFTEYLIGSSTARPLREFLMEMHDSIAPDLEFVFGDVPFTGVDLPLSYFDCSKTELDTGFRAQVSFAEGCRRTRDWIIREG